MQWYIYCWSYSALLTQLFYPMYIIICILFNSLHARYNESNQIFRWGNFRSNSMVNTERFQVRFWGVRGSYPTPGSQTTRYGGNTTSVEVLTGTHTLILD